jgi:hypothetical protein
MSNQSAKTLPAFGARFRLTETVERFPHFRAPAGAAGTVVEACPDVICLHMDDYLPGCEDWDNEIVWTTNDDYDENGEPSPTPSVAAAFHYDTAPLDEPANPHGRTDTLASERRAVRARPSRGMPADCR